MTQPNPPEIILPDGRTAYYNPYTSTYTTSRSYAMRMQRGFARGLAQFEARGQRANERRYREQYTQGRYGVTPEELYARNAQEFQNLYGFDYAYWNYLQREYLNEINRMTSEGGRIEPYMVQSVKLNWETGWRDPMRPEITSWQEWVELHLAERREAMYAYREGDKSVGAQNFQMRSSVPPIEFWWYR